MDISVSNSIVSPGFYQSLYLPETEAYRDRVESDGGEIVDINYVNAWYAALIAQSLDSASGFIGGPNLGVKKSGGNIEKFYNLLSSNDAMQSVEGDRAGDETNINAGARVASGAGTDHYDLDTTITLDAGNSTILWWQIITTTNAGYWAGTASSSQNGVRATNTQLGLRAGGTWSFFDIPNADQIANDVMRSCAIVRSSTDQDNCYLQGVLVDSPQTNAVNFSCPNLFDGVSTHFDSSIATMCLLETAVNTTQREALEAVGNNKNLLPNNFLQSGEFCIALIPDIQVDIAAGGSRSQDQADWIAANASAQNIKLVAYLGDQANDGSDTDEHALAKSIIDTFLEDVPTLWVFGNHDEDDDSATGTTRDTTNFDTEFPTTELSSQSWWSGGFEGSFSGAAYYLFSAEGEDYIAVTLPFGPSQDEIDWANTLIGTTYSARTALLFTHSYVDQEGSISGTSGNDADVYALGSDIHVGTEIKSEVSDLRSNLRFIFGGHHIGRVGTARNSVTVSSENQHGIYLNYQDQANGGDGYMGLLYINPTTEQARLVVYSPTTQSFKPDSEWQHKFTVGL